MAMILLFTRFTLLRGTIPTVFLPNRCRFAGHGENFEPRHLYTELFIASPCAQNSHVFSFARKGDPLKQRLWRRREEKWYTIGGTRAHAIRDLIHDRHSYICVPRINIIGISIVINSRRYGSVR